MLQPAHVPLIGTTRGGRVECVHHGSVVIVDGAGAPVAGAGDLDALHFTRSTLKPLQALPFVEDGGLGHFGFGSQELALLCASHNGETVHIALAQSILDAAGARESDLQCGAHPPRYFAATGKPCPPHVHATALHHNCSGKHSGFLAYCRLHGHRLRDYLDPASPLQTRIRNTVQRYAPGEPVVMGIDGCNAPNFALPLRRIAQAYWRIACDDDPAQRALFYAMTRHPDLVSGTARTDLALMQTGRGDWVSKIGADGLQALGVRSRGLGIVVRIAGGDTNALHVATVEVLHQIGLLDTPDASALGPHFRPVIRNARGAETGRFVPLFRLPRLCA